MQIVAAIINSTLKTKPDFSEQWAQQNRSPGLLWALGRREEDSLPRNAGDQRACEFAKAELAGLQGGVLQVGSAGSGQEPGEAGRTGRMWAGGDAA